jgi:hypothetical protein
MVGLIIIGVLVLIVSYAWAKGISDMHQKHPEYKGEDFLADWDDDKVHTEDIC